MYNVGFGQFEKSKQEIQSTFGTLNTGFFEAQKANIINTWNYNPTYSLWRKGEELSAYNQDNTLLNRDDLNKKYANLGLNFKEDTRKEVVDYLVKRKELERERASIIQRGPQNIFAKGSFFLTSLGTSFADPVNIVASFIPVVGQGRFAAMVARSGKNVARMKKGFVEGLVGNTAVEPIVYGVHRSQQSDYDQYDAFINIAAGGILGSTFHAGFGRIGDYLAKVQGKPNIYQRLAAVSPDHQQALLRYSVGKVLRGEKVDTGDVVVNKTRIGDKQLNQLDDQIAEFKTLYAEAIKKGDRKSAKTYLLNLRNLQKTERQMFQAKQKAAEKAMELNKSQLKQSDERGSVTEQDIKRNEKNTAELEQEAQNFVEREKFHQKQLDIKDEDIAKDTNILADRAEIKKIDNIMKNKNKIRDAIRAGSNCIKRRGS